MEKGNKVKALNLSGFTVFEDVKFEFSPGVNVIIGKNGTGKTHLIKIIYSILRTASKTIETKRATKSKDVSPDNIPILFHSEVRKNFKIDDPFDLIRKKPKVGEYHIELTTSKDKTIRINQIKLKDRGGRIRLGGFGNDIKATESVYLPPQEMLSLYEGFIGSWEKRENGFDATYYELAKLLELAPLKSTEFLHDTITTLEEKLGAKVLKEAGRFYLVYKWGRIEAHLAAEGLRKLSSIIYLLANGSINAQTVIFWDEPEVNFNPSLIDALVELIKSLAKNGVQLFITTHDYLLSQKLSLIAEYEPTEIPMKFFCLGNEGNKGVTVSEGNTLVDIDSNPILNEFAEYYDFERKVYSQSLKSK